MKISTFIRNTLVLAVIIGLMIVASSAAQAEAAAPVAAKLTLTAPVSGTIELGKTQTVSWKSSNYTPSTVRVNVIRKVSSNPSRYALVRTVASATKNDGSATWVPAKGDIGSGLSLEIGCAPSAAACQAGVTTASSIAVVNSTTYANTAAAFQAIEASNNK